MQSKDFVPEIFGTMNKANIKTERLTTLWDGDDRYGNSTDDYMGDLIDNHVGDSFDGSSEGVKTETLNSDSVVVHDQDAPDHDTNSSDSTPIKTMLLRRSKDVTSRHVAKKSVSSISHAGCGESDDWQ